MADQSLDMQAGDDSHLWLPDIVTCIAHFLSANEVSSILRFINRAISRQLANCKTVQLSFPLSSHIFKKCWGRPETFRGYTRKQRMKLLCLTAASGSIANLEVALDNAGLVVEGAGYSDLLAAAAEAGQLDVCMMLRARGCPWGGSLAAAARGGHRHVCEWMLASGCHITSKAVNAAARSGHEGLMHWLMTHQVVRPSRGASLYRAGLLCGAAAENLSLADFQGLLQQLLAGRQQPEEALNEMEQGEILAAAASSSTPDWRAKVEWLEEQGYPRTVEACFSAARCRPDEEAASRLQWLHSRCYTLDMEAPKYLEAVDAVASRGSLSALRLLIEQAGVGPDQYAIRVATSRAAAKNGYLAMLQYLHTSGLLLEQLSIELSEPRSVVQCAAGEGHLPVVVWAVEALGVMPRNERRLLNWAARSGSVELMTWLRDRGWTWDRETMDEASRSGCVAAVEWLVEQGCPWPMSAYFWASRFESMVDLAMIRCLHRLGCPWGPGIGGLLEICFFLSNESPIPLLRCFLDLGCPVDWDAAARMAEERPPEKYRTALLTWLGEERQRRSLGAQQ